MSIKFVPFYFPQLYTIPENDVWWGKDYTDWDRVKSAIPNTENHYQPRVPLDRNYYDQSLSDTQMKQIELAIQYGIYGFNFYHYWFNGKLLLEKPLNNFKSLDHTLNYCITWANESWTKRWEGKISDVLIKQEHKLDYIEWENHFNYLLPFFKDDRYIKIDDKPIFCIYRPDIIPDIDEFISFFQSLALKNNLNGLYFIALRAYEPSSESVYNSFDAIMNFQPRAIFGKKYGGILKRLFEKPFRRMPESIQIGISGIFNKFKKQGNTYDYDFFWQELIRQSILDKLSTKKIFQTIIGDWDNTARYRERSLFFSNFTTQKFENYLSKLIKVCYSRIEDNIIFINAWNEWSEGAYLEPDERNKFKILEILEEIKNKL
jgi:hypothetical protein